MFENMTIKEMASNVSHEDLVFAHEFLSDSIISIWENSDPSDFADDYDLATARIDIDNFSADGYEVDFTAEQLREGLCVCAALYIQDNE